MPKLSIIVPNYNHARFLPQRIESILRQTFQDYELILLDDCSTDNSTLILSQYVNDPRVRFEFNQSNSGSTFRQWNKGVRLAKGKYIWIAESDDYADLRLIERLVTILDGDPEVVFAYCRAWCVIEGDHLDGFVDRFYANLHAWRWTADFRVDGREECRNYLVQCNTITNTSGVIFRRAIYEKVGGADENLRLCGDWKLWAAMALKGKIAFLAEPLNYIRFHEGTVRNKTIREAVDAAETLQVIRWILERVIPDDAVLERIYEKQASAWVHALMSLHVPLERKRTIVRDVRAIDPHPFRRAFHPALTTVRLKLMRHWRALT